MDNLVAQVMKKLDERDQTIFRCAYVKNITPPDNDIFLDHGQVFLQNVAINLVFNLYSMNQQDLWVAWILDGISYDVNFRLMITQQMINFIPRMMVLDWPMLFVVDNKRPLIASRNRIISRSELAAFPDESIIIQSQNQKMTADAIDICRIKNLKIKMRTEENCIWQK